MREERKRNGSGKDSGIQGSGEKSRDWGGVEIQMKCIPPTRDEWKSIPCVRAGRDTEITDLRNGNPSAVRVVVGARCRSVVAALSPDAIDAPSTDDIVRLDG